MYLDEKLKQGIKIPEFLESRRKKNMQWWWPEGGEQKNLRKNLVVEQIFSQLVLTNLIGI